MRSRAVSRIAARRRLMRALKQLYTTPSSIARILSTCHGEEGLASRVVCATLLYITRLSMLVKNSRGGHLVPVIFVLPVVCQMMIIY